VQRTYQRDVAPVISFFVLFAISIGLLIFFSLRRASTSDAID